MAPHQDDKWVLQICERTYRRSGKAYEVWQTISRPMSEPTAMARLRTRHSHPKPHRILTGVAEALNMYSVLREVQA